MKRDLSVHFLELLLMYVAESQTEIEKRVRESDITVCNHSCVLINEKYHFCTYMSTVRMSTLV